MKQLITNEQRKQLKNIVKSEVVIVEIAKEYKQVQDKLIDALKLQNENIVTLTKSIAKTIGE
jgi:hypothetical protein